MKLKTKISIMIFIIILVVGLYIGYHVKNALQNLKINWKEMLTGKVTVILYSNVYHADRF
jgi:hypothetical protein